MSDSLRPYLLTRGDFVGPYEIRRVVGRGRHSEVYVAMHPTARREVALKAFLFDSPPENGLELCLQEEAEAQIALRHPNLARVLEAGAEDGTYYLIMEYVEGMSLRDRLATHPTGLGRDHTLRLFSQIASAVATAHDVGLVHAGLKPDNVLISTTGRPVITEFALPSIQAQRAPESSGASGYLAPEVAAGGPPTLASDIYALGVLLYEMVTGNLPAPTEAARRGGWPPVPSRVNVGLDPRFDRVILTALHPDPAERFPSPRAMLAELEREDIRVEYETVALDRKTLPNPPTRPPDIRRFEQTRMELPVDDSVVALVPRHPSSLVLTLAIVAIAIAFALLLIALM